MKQNVLNTPRIITILVVVFIGFMIHGCGGGSGSSFHEGLIDSNTGDSVPPVSGAITLSWNAPTTNTDGSPLKDLSGYIIYYGTTSQNYTLSIDVGRQTTATINSLSSGTWYFSVIAYNISGKESDYSNEVSITI